MSEKSKMGNSTVWIDGIVDMLECAGEREQRLVYYHTRALTGNTGNEGSSMRTEEYRDVIKAVNSVRDPKKLELIERFARRLA